jgi:hypothetical protein
MHFTESIDDSAQLNTIPGPKIILSASGMCDAGRIVHHLKHNIWRKDCHILFVGYQAEGTLGRRIIEGAKKVSILGETLQVNAKVHTIGGLSAHADRDEMLSWLKFYQASKPTVFIVHGDHGPSEEFAESVREALGLTCVVPQWHETADITFTQEGFNVSWLRAEVNTGFREQHERWKQAREKIDAYINGFTAEASGAPNVLPAAVLEKLNAAVNDILEEFHLEQSRTQL